MAGNEKPDTLFREGRGRVFFDAVLHPHRSLAVGRFLTAEERAALARALRKALARWRCTPNPCAAT